MSVAKLFDLTGKVAVVTGGAGHLGSSMSKILVAAGARVWIAGHNATKCESIANKISKELNVECKSIYVDISSEESIQLCFSEVVKRHGSIDILVNNAFYGASAPVHKMSIEDWSKGIDGSINSVFKCTKTALPYMMEQKQGVVINIASMYGIVSPDPSIYRDSGQNNPANYGAGKAAVIQFTKYIACHYGKYGIRANSISPGPFPNEKVQENKEFIAELAKKNPLGRVGSPEELQGALLFLASNASSFVTGHNLCVDGGWTVW